MSDSGPQPSTSRLFIVDDTDSSIHYSGGQWVTDNTSLSPGDKGPPLYGTLHGSHSTASEFTFTFNGTSIVVWGAVLSDAPVRPWNCTVDNHTILMGPIPPANGGSQISICQTTTGLEDGRAHTLRVTGGGTENFPAWFDYIEFTPFLSESVKAVADIQFDQTDEEIHYGENWHEVEIIAMATNTSGSVLNFDFNGHSMAWYGFYDNIFSHIPTTASYSIDGASPINFTVTNPTTNSSKFVVGNLVFQTPRYSPGQHHLEVMYYGDEHTTPLTLQHLIVQNSTSGATLLPTPEVSTAAANLPSTTSPGSSAPTSVSSGKPVSSVHVRAILGGCLPALIIVVVIGVFFLRRRGPLFMKHRASESVKPFSHIPFTRPNWPHNRNGTKVAPQIGRQYSNLARPSKALSRSIPSGDGPETGENNTGSDGLNRRTSERLVIHEDSGIRLPEPDREVTLIDVPPTYTEL